MDNAFIHADIFFFVTTVSVALLTILAVIAWIYVMKILHNVRYISEKARTESEFLAEELRRLRYRLATERWGFVTIWRFIRLIKKRYK